MLLENIGGTFHVGLVNGHDDRGAAPVHAFGIGCAILFRHEHAAQRGPEPFLITIVIVGRGDCRTGEAVSCSGSTRIEVRADARLGEFLHGVGGVRAAVEEGGDRLLCHWAFLLLELLAFVFKAFDFGPLLAQGNRNLCDVRRPVTGDPQLLFDEEPLLHHKNLFQDGNDRHVSLPCGARVERRPVR